MHDSKKNCDDCSCVDKCAREEVDFKRLMFHDRFEIVLDERGVTIALEEQFYLERVRARFPQETPAMLETLELNEKEFEGNSARFVFCQIKRSLQNNITSEMYYESKILELLFQILHAEQGQQAMRLLRDEDHAAIDKVKVIICKNLDDCPKICELAKAVHTCPAKLQADFKAASGQTIHEFARAKRLTKAAELLAKTRQPIYIIAKRIGCKKAGRFSEIFRNAYGVTPSEYREGNTWGN